MTTTILDLLGSLLLIVALGLVITSVFGLPAGLAAAGAALLGLSWVIDRRAGAKK